MKTTRTLKRWAALTLLLALLLGLAVVPAWAEEGEATPAEVTMWDDTSAQVMGVDGQEYVIAPKGGDPDWSKALEPEDGLVAFADLTPATAYTIYTRVKAAEGQEAGEAKTTALTTPLSSLSLTASEEYDPGSFLFVAVEPEDAQGLTYQWYYDSIATTEEGAEQHTFTPIEDADTFLYVVRAADAGQYLAVKVFLDEEEVGAMDSLGPVEEAPFTPKVVMSTPTSAGVAAMEGQEYTIAPKGDDPDWSKLAKVEDGFASFEDLTPATAYTIFTRVEGGDGAVKTTDLTMSLAGLGVFSEDDYVPGAVFTLTTDPEDAQGLTYQWYYDSITTTEEGAEMHDFTPIKGATGTTYTIQAADAGKYLAVKAFLGEEEVGSVESMGPVEGEAPAPAPCPRDATCPISQFTDAKTDAWYHDGVHWALETGLMKGVSDTAFAPGGTATRAMVVTMLWRLEGEPEAKAPAAFTDVTAGSWYEKAVNWAAASGVVTGTSATTFAPNDPVTREQLVTIMYRYAQYKNVEMSIDENILDFDDALTISPWAVEPFRWAVQEGIVTGMGDNKLSPKSNATRAQIATIFQRFVDALD